MNTIVCIGSSQTSDYSFLVPLAALFWRDLIGHEPRIFLIGTAEEWSNGKNRVVYDALRHHEINHIIIPRIGGIWNDGSLAQNVRQHAACDRSIHDSQWMMMSDADLFPLRRDFYHQHIDGQYRAVCLYSNGDHYQGKEETLARYDAGLGFQSIPTCHVVMRAHDWRSAYDLTPDDVATNLWRTLEGRAKRWLSKCKCDNGLATWCIDQWYMTERLSRQGWFPEEALLVERAGHPPPDRLDRGHPAHWKEPFDADRWTDAHVHKAPYSDENWATIVPVVDALLPQHSAWAKSYRDAFATADGLEAFAKFVRPARIIPLTDAVSPTDDPVLLHGDGERALRAFELAAPAVGYGSAVILSGVDIELAGEIAHANAFRTWLHGNDLRGFPADAKSWIKSESQGENSYGTHLPYLLEAVRRTSGPVLELGSGPTSTQHLHEICADLGRILVTVDNSEEWLDKVRHLSAPWHHLELCENPAESARLNEIWGVVFVDHAPGETRARAIDRAKLTADYIVVHDTESLEYGMENALASFRNRRDFRIHRPWTSVVSNIKDIFDCVLP